MTDREKFLALIAEWGLIPDDDPQQSRDVCFTAEGTGATPERKVEGYDGFMAIFNFDENGKFECLGVYE